MGISSVLSLFVNDTTFCKNKCAFQTEGVVMSF